MPLQLTKSPRTVLVAGWLTSGAFAAEGRRYPDAEGARVVRTVGDAQASEFSGAQKSIGGVQESSPTIQ